MFYKNKKVLVTGAGGLVGSQVAKMLHEQGAIVRASYRGREVPSWVGDVEKVKADFMNIDDVKKILKETRSNKLNIIPKFGLQFFYSKTINFPFFVYV